MQWQQAQREIELLKRELENTKQIKNNQILQLEHTLSRAHLQINDLERQLTKVQAENNHLREQYRGLQHFSKQRTHALTHKNIRIAALEKQLEDIAHRKNQESEATIQKLLSVIRSQENELSILLGDHQNYLQECEKISLAYEHLKTENLLSKEYNNELEKQVEELEKQSASLETWASQAHEELTQQNQQSNDLLGQVEYMVECWPGGENRVF